ncbi:hypothetical protein GCM10009066_10260 [Halarchaeum salinum]|uniref:Uncharacterized protein n=1 Tax=Halarchaeum salinum TaxID=489912 RepID=A0AAV3S798_9EURY
MQSGGSAVAAKDHECSPSNQLAGGNTKHDCDDTITEAYVAAIRDHVNRGQLRNRIHDQPTIRL